MEAIRSFGHRGSILREVRKFFLPGAARKPSDISDRERPEILTCLEQAADLHERLAQLDKQALEAIDTILNHGRH